MTVRENLVEERVESEQVENGEDRIGQDYHHVDYAEALLQEDLFAAVVGLSGTEADWAVNVLIVVVVIDLVDVPAFLLLDEIQHHEPLKALEVDRY